MSKIKVLDDLTITKIAAGEVIENPASIVKELVENSIDAGAKNIVIDIVKGGKESIRITDDGSGMTREDLELAFKRHSTSKLSAIEDIYSIMSLGFRGEALASVSSVSKMEVLTKTDDSLAGTQAYIEDGEIKSINSVGTPKGTTMIVRDLFFNLPVRKKFMKSDKSEGNYINNIITRLALGNPDVSFKFIRDNKVTLQTSRSNSLKNTIYTVLGKEFAENIIPIEYEDRYIKLHGYISNNNLYRGNRGHQYLYMNGRYIMDFAISKAIENRYKTLIPINRYPTYVLNLEIDPGEVDVNIHPTKQEIKFTDPSRVIGTISNIVDENLVSSLFIPKMEFNRKDSEKKAMEKEKELPKLFEMDEKEVHVSSDRESKENITIKDLTDEDYSGSKDEVKDQTLDFDELDKLMKVDEDSERDYDNSKSNYLDSYKGKHDKPYSQSSKNSPRDTRKERLDRPYNPEYKDNFIDKNDNDKDKSRIPIEEVDISSFFDDLKFDGRDRLDDIDFKDEEAKDLDSKENKPYIVEEQKIEDHLLDIDPIGRVFNTYIIAESKSKDTVFFIDQHAAHERIMFEKYKKEFENEEISVQQLMFPEVVDLTPDEMSNYYDNIDLFTNLGFDTEEFGPNSVAIRGVPMIFGNPETKDLFIQVLDNIHADISSNYEMKIEKIMKIACTNAIKSGDKISNEEIMELVRQLTECEKPYTCPHGRPTIIEMSKTEMEKEFLRII